MGERLLSGVFMVGLLIAATPGFAAEDAAQFAGSDTCATCHEDAASALIHRGSGAHDAGCETCHGPGKAHVDAGGDATKIRSSKLLTAHELSAMCTGCHVAGNTQHWAGTAHDRNDVTCNSCHAVHRKEGPSPSLLAKGGITETCVTCHKLQRAQNMRSSHMPLVEGALTCDDCHNPHGSVGPSLLRDASVNDNCYRCHAEKRGPVLFEHPPVKENCLNCHLAHGSMHESLLVAKRPRLCQNCHINSRHPSEPHQAIDRYTFNTSCQNCHPQVHGSNHPSGVRMMR